MGTRKRWVAAALLLAGCVKNPATGERQLALITKDQEIAMGQQSKAQVEQTMPRVDDPQLQAYVSAVGMKLAKASERPDLPWSFEVVDDPSPNAFALPGGPIFVTRGLLDYLGSEAELAGVLGHEIGHVTARHSVEQLSKAELAEVGLGLGMVLSERMRSVGQAAGAGLQLLFLKFGRDDERQADELGFGYMTKHGYAPEAMARTFQMLEGVSKRAGGGRVPTWASTHPDPGDRAKTAQARAQKAPAAGKVEGREAYLARVDGLVFGEDPRQGYMKGETFVHPALDFQLTLPSGWKVQNMPAALVAVSPKQDAGLQLSGVGRIAPEEAVQKFLAQEGVKPLGAPAPAAGGAAAWFQAATKQGPVAGLVAYVRAGQETLQVVQLTPTELAAAHKAEFERVLGSYGPITDPAAREVEPARIEVQPLARDMTVEELAKEPGGTAPPDLLALVNGVAPGARLQAGQQVKRIVGGMPEAQAGPIAGPAATGTGEGR
ncbi:MAG: M48 family metalloprotease [Anaeromyxobacter sp.]